MRFSPPNATGKMRYLLLVFCLVFSSITGYSQHSPDVTFPLAADTKKITYTDQVQVVGTSQAELYARAKVWLAASTPLTHAVLQTERQQAGTFIARATMQFMMVRPGHLVNQPFWYTITLTVQDGRYRYVLSDFHILLAGKSLPLESQLAPVTQAQERQKDEIRLMPLSITAKRVIAQMQAHMKMSIAQR